MIGQTIKIFFPKRKVQTLHKHESRGTVTSSAQSLSDVFGGACFLAIKSFSSPKWIVSSLPGHPGQGTHDQGLIRINKDLRYQNEDLNYPQGRLRDPRPGNRCLSVEIRRSSKNRQSGCTGPLGFVDDDHAEYDLDDRSTGTSRSTETSKSDDRWSADHRRIRPPDRGGWLRPGVPKAVLRSPR